MPPNGSMDNDWKYLAVSTCKAGYTFYQPGYFSSLILLHLCCMKTFINNWITAANQFDTEKYLTFYLPDAILDDPSVGRKFKGHTGIRDYFVSYFIGYQTHTKLVKLQVIDDTHAHVEVAFTGEFPEGEIGGTFDITWREGRISFIKADLIAQV